MHWITLSGSGGGGDAKKQRLRGVRVSGLILHEQSVVLLLLLLPPVSRPD